MSIHSCVGPSGVVIIVGPTINCHSMSPGTWTPLDWGITGGERAVGPVRSYWPDRT